MDISLDYRELFKILNKHKVKYLIVGAYAVIYYSEPRYTKDIDVWVSPDIKNAVKVFEALKKFGAPLKGVTVEDFTNKNLFYQIGIAPVRIDIIMGLSGLDFDVAWKNRAISKYGDIPINIIGIEELKKSKLKSKRKTDIIDLEILGKVKPKKKEKQMRKKILFVLLVSGFYLLLSTHKGFAQEQLTITTYYPSPYGSYRELRTQRMAIGDTYAGPDYCWPPTTCTNQISAAADLIVEGYVGIGTYAPPRPLHVVGSASGRHTAAIFGYNRIGLVLGNVGGAGNEKNYGIIQSVDLSGASENFNIPLAINSRGGNVGIGTDDPRSTLDVRGGTTNICVTVYYSASTGVSPCPTGFNIALGSAAGIITGVPSSGYFICCKACQDGGPPGGPYVYIDGICD